MPKIEEMYAYISHEKDDPDDEGVTAFKLGGIWMPMVGADMKRMTSLGEQAQMLANFTGQKITLVKFSVRTDLETIEPWTEGCPHGIPLHLRGKANACLAGGPKTEDHPGGQFCNYLESVGKCKFESE